MSSQRAVEIEALRSRCEPMRDALLLHLRLCEALAKAECSCKKGHEGTCPSCVARAVSVSAAEALPPSVLERVA